MPVARCGTEKVEARLKTIFLDGRKPNVEVVLRCPKHEAIGKNTGRFGEMSLPAGVKSAEYLYVRDGVPYADICSPRVDC